MAESIVAPVLYAVQPPFRDLADLVLQHPAPDDLAEWQEELRRAIDAIAGLTAVDGATIMTERYDVARVRREDPPPPRQSHRRARHRHRAGRRTAATSVTTPTQLGGTRHLSAAQFVHDQRDASALVASQDGRFTIFQWSEREDMVHAHRVEALLL